MHLAQASIACVISEGVVILDKLNLTELKASSSVNPMEIKVLEGLVRPVEQAEPAEI
jgi:hypothetical protein